SRKSQKSKPTLDRGALALILLTFFLGFAFQAEPTFDWGGITHLLQAYELVREVQLELTDDSALGSMDDVKLHDRQFYVLDMWVAKAVLRFDLDGRFLGLL